MAAGFSCDFEQNFCSWHQDKTDTYDWIRIQGPTASPGTGPDADHHGDKSESLELKFFCVDFHL